MKPEQDILDEINTFFKPVFEHKTNSVGVVYASFKDSWLNELGLNKNIREEAKVKQTVKKLQEHLRIQFGEKRIKIEAKVAENMELRFKDDKGNIDFDLDFDELSAFDLLDTATGTAFEFSLSDAFAEFFKDLLKAFMDSRVKKLYLCMRNHNYKINGGKNDVKKSGYRKVVSSSMVKQYVQLAKLYKIEVVFINVFPENN